MSNQAKVFWIPLKEKGRPGSLASKARALMNAAGLQTLLKPGMLVGVKQHFGEEGNTGFIRPDVCQAVGDFVKASSACPLLVETNTLYRGKRSNTYDHLILAHKHGFTMENIGMPVAILDGLHGQNQMAVPINGKHFQMVHVVSDLPFFGALVVISHVKGHVAAGLGGAIKNLSMGFSSRAGKLAQHLDFQPEIDSKLCLRCELCGRFCPAEAIALQDESMQVDYEKCIGCGECHAVCQSDAIRFDWGGADEAFQEKVAEYAFGAVKDHRGRALYLNFFNNISRHCDCWSGTNPVIYPDVGIFASLDPVAADRACYDMGEKVFGKNIFRELWPGIDSTVQMRHGEMMGLGTQEYDLVEVADHR